MTRVYRALFALFVSLFLVGGLYAGDLQKASPSVQKLIKTNDLEVVEFDAVKQMIGNGTRKGAKALIIDARPPKKYTTGHLPSAINIPDTAFDKFYPSIEKVAKDKPIIVYCGGFKCEKSPIVGGLLKKRGFTDIKVYIAGEPEWKKKSYIEVDTPVMQSAYKNNSAFVIDARPYKKYLAATIPGAISIPDTKMEELLGRFPASKQETVITFCGGYDCEKSHIVANKLISLGYESVKVYAAGVPGWKKMGYATTGASTPKKGATKDDEAKQKFVNGVMMGLDEGTVDGEWFAKNYSNLDNIQFVDVRPADNFKEGHIEGAINIYADKLEPKEFVAKLPKGKVLIFTCASGARALEAWEKAKEGGADLQSTFYFDANINCDKSNKCTIEPNEPLGV